MMHTISSNKNTVWPYPRLLAHRGAGKAAPENTLAALRKGAAQGYQMFEYDVQLSRDEVAVLIHDYSLKRTAQVEGNVSDKSLAELLHYDFGAWHSAPYIGEPILTLAGVANFSIPQQLHSNIEIKAAPGLEALTGARVAQQAQQLWRRATLPPVLSSFSLTALQAVAQAAPELPRALLIEQAQPIADIVAQLQRLGCVGLHIAHQLFSPDLLAACQQAGVYICLWTVNDADAIRAFLAQGVEAVVTDSVQYSPDSLLA